MTSRYAALSREELATLVPELLLIGQLIDRSGMAWCISNSVARRCCRSPSRSGGASPIYTKRMQKALKYEGDDIFTIFKGLQLDIGAPPQFMDFRYTVHDRWHGEFHLDHCGALLDVEPMGEDYVSGMCHDIEDPTFDATAVATNRKAQVRPIHRPPRIPADRHPHCAWTVIIDESYPEVASTRRWTSSAEPAPPNRTRSDRPRRRGTGGLFGGAAVRCRLRRVLALGAGPDRRRGVPADAPAEPVVRDRGRKAGGTDVELARSICTKQLIGIAGVAAERIHRALGLPSGIEGALRVLELHPLLNPAAYVDAEFGPDVVHVRRSPAYEDGSWISLVSPVEMRPLQAIVGPSTRTSTSRSRAPRRTGPRA